jgi:hypothetical protein
MKRPNQARYFVPGLSNINPRVVINNKHFDVSHKGPSISIQPVGAQSIFDGIEAHEALLRQA